MASPKARASAAFHAMRELGIPAETIKPKLKKLLKMYGNNWSLIERYNYGALADFMFETEEEDHKEVKEADNDAPLGNPLLRQERLPLKGPTLDLEMDDLGGGGGEAKWLSIIGSSKGEISRSKRPYQDGASGQNDSMRIEASLERRIPCYATEKYEDQQRRTTTTPQTAGFPESSVPGFEIASSEMGDVSMHLDFPFVPPNFCRPNIDAVCKALEEKYMTTYQITDPNFSIKKVMKEFCQTCLEIRTQTVPAADSWNEIFRATSGQI